VCFLHRLTVKLAKQRCLVCALKQVEIEKNANKMKAILF